MKKKKITQVFERAEKHNTTILKTKKIIHIS